MRSNILVQVTFVDIFRDDANQSFRLKRVLGLKWLVWIGAIEAGTACYLESDRERVPRSPLPS